MGGLGGQIRKKPTIVVVRGPNIVPRSSETSPEQAKPAPRPARPLAPRRVSSRAARRLGLGSWQHALSSVEYFTGFTFVLPSSALVSRSNGALPTQWSSPGLRRLACGCVTLRALDASFGEVAYRLHVYWQPPTAGRASLSHSRHPGWISFDLAMPGVRGGPRQSSHVGPLAVTRVAALLTPSVLGMQHRTAWPAGCFRSLTRLSLTHCESSFPGPGTCPVGARRTPAPASAALRLSQ